ncbi:hypothetical protein ACFL1H_04935 [Nanoarchaeota archaeon]
MGVEKINLEKMLGEAKQKVIEQKMYGLLEEGKYDDMLEEIKHTENKPRNEVRDDLVNKLIELNQHNVVIEMLEMYKNGGKIAHVYGDFITKLHEEEKYGEAVQVLNILKGKGYKELTKTVE